MNHCAICQKVITVETDSKEHVFPNSVGGRKKISGFICQSCNSKAGQTWDAEIARQLNPICLLLEITRERTKEPPSQEFKSTGGQSYVRHADGSLTLPKPIFKETTDAAGQMFHITARNMKELKMMLAGVKRKYPQIDEAATLKKAVTETSYPKDLLHIPINFGGAIAGRSIVKTALAFAVESGIEANSCEAACEYLRDSTVAPRWDFYPADPIQNRPPAVALHCVAIQGGSGKLVACVEYFGFRRMWVPLSDHYTGPDIQASYAFDPVTNKEITLIINALPLNAPDASLAEICKQTEVSLTEVLLPASEAAKSRELDRVVREAWSRACEKMGINSGTSITVPQQHQLAALIVKEMTPFLEHQMHNPFENFNPQTTSEN